MNDPEDKAAVGEVHGASSWCKRLCIIRPFTAWSMGKKMLVMNTVQNKIGQDPLLQTINLDLTISKETKIWHVKDKRPCSVLFIQVIMLQFYLKYN